ncbi:MAG: V-type ATP synthase subunit B [Gemmatimonadetes bacterium]|nr:V-type ATP synthase subunit B [Gemmatimonadota bacterium]NIR77235.1 V-type ATP synthase subunit B [Gemmatimonadota bacterium]NIT85754.1 V-type ATP synthase subunit B [Gemmatimonadota bacterium]NIU29579.1 V-type ATP synthase subunit B [Gemmatimonadota bacterium]NIU34628.1 V-type ATP synthase subunit B [Gemmatimonadota bacterium]
MSPLSRIRRGALAAAGPLLYLPGSPGTALGEWVTVRGRGREVRRGQVIEAAGDVVVVQLLEDSLGLAPGTAEVELEGEVAAVPVGRELLGRLLDGRADPADGLPPPVGEALRPIQGAPINPVRRTPPENLIETGISAIDGLNTLVRGQKLPIFSGPGLPGLEVAARIVEWARAPREGEAFAVVFVGLGITERETRTFVGRFERSGVLEHTTVYLNQTRDPTVERLLAPRAALAQAEFLAFEEGYHVLVVMADILHYCDALREMGAIREEIPGRQGYPGSMYTDLASIFERAGILRGREGSVTQIPILTMPDDDITHPIPDLTGYITEGQIVLSRELHRRGVFPPVDVLPSLSRVMNAAIGEGRTVPEHREWANQLYALYARGREARLTAAIVGEAGLSESDRIAQGFADDFESGFVHQEEGRRALDDTLASGWDLLDGIPLPELNRLAPETLEARRAAREERAEGEAP